MVLGLASRPGPGGGGNDEDAATEEDLNARLATLNDGVDASDGEEEEAPLPPEPNTNPTSIVDISVVRAAAAAGVVVLVSCAITYPSGHNPAGVIVSLGIFERAFVKYANKLDKLGMWLLCWQYTPPWAYVVLLDKLMPVAPSSGLPQ